MLSEQNVRFAEAISIICGWLYFFAWSLSFYPQPILNYARRTTQGLTADFPLLNVLGFTCYTVSSTAFLYSSVVRRQYAERHPLSPEPTVRFNDFAFGLHASILVLVTYSQFWPRLWGWKPRPEANRSVNKITLGLAWGSVVGVATTILIVLVGSGNGVPQNRQDWASIDVVYSLTYVKLLLTVFKYIPQVVYNYRRKSTVGWSIQQVSLDFFGGILSLVQLVIDSALQADWSGLTGNPVKLGLANISLLFDIIFIVQHFVLYGPVEESDEAVKSAANEPSREQEPLLPSTTRDRV